MIHNSLGWGTCSIGIPKTLGNFVSTPFLQLLDYSRFYLLVTSHRDFKT